MTSDFPTCHSTISSKRIPTACWIEDVNDLITFNDDTNSFLSRLSNRTRQKSLTNVRVKRIRTPKSVHNIPNLSIKLSGQRMRDDLFTCKSHRHNVQVSRVKSGIKDMEHRIQSLVDKKQIKTHRRQFTNSIQVTRVRSSIKPRTITRLTPLNARKIRVERVRFPHRLLNNKRFSLSSSSSSSLTFARVVSV